MTNNITEQDFAYLEKPDVDFYALELKTGKWAGVSYIYGKVSIKETPELDTATLQFNYTIEDSGQFEHDDLINSIEFKNHLGDILQFVIKDSLDYKEAKIGHINTDTNTRTITSD